MTRDEAVAALGASPLFDRLRPTELRELAGVVTTRRYERGEFVFFEGDRGDALFVMVEGLVKVVVGSVDGDEVILTTLRPPDCFGELAVVDGGARSASVQALAPTTALALHRDALLDLVAGRREVADVLLRSLGGLVRRLSDQVADLVFLDLQGRVAKLLVGLAADHGRPRHDGLEMALPVTQSDLASMVGGSRQSVNQVLQALERHGLLRRRGRALVVTDLEGLRRRSGSVEQRRLP